MGSIRRVGILILGEAYNSFNRGEEGSRCSWVAFKRWAQGSRSRFYMFGDGWEIFREWL